MTKIWTIGHSTLDWTEFLHLLATNGVRAVVDVRTFPGSRRHPQFNREIMTSALTSAQLKYVWMPDLGGKRTPAPNSINTGWSEASFRGFADHMQTTTFKNALAELEMLAGAESTAYMCSEGDWVRCHRGLISDALKAKGWDVLHISPNAVTQHPYTRVARVEGGQLSYSQERFL